MNQSKDSVKSITLRGLLVFDRCNNLCGGDRFGDQYHRQPDYNASFGRGRFRTVGHCLFRDLFAYRFYSGCCSENSPDMVRSKNCPILSFCEKRETFFFLYGIVN